MYQVEMANARLDKMFSLCYLRPELAAILFGLKDDPESRSKWSKWSDHYDLES